MTNNKPNLSIKQIAELAQVSVATISRVINQKGGYTPETEKRVLQVIEENHYMPNLVAKGLRTSKTRNIGLIVPDILNEFFARLVLDIQMELFQYGYLTMVCNVNESEKLEKQLVKALIAQNISGLILISGRTRKISVQNLPVIYIDRRPNEEEIQESNIVIESDNVKGGYLATKELIECGCKKIGFVTNILVDSSKVKRYEGYCKAIMEADLPLNPNWAIRINSVTQDDAFEGVGTAIRNGLDVDGLVCVNDTIAIGTIRAIQAEGLKVPRDIKVVGFDDISLASLYQPSLTTIHQYEDEMAKLAAKLMMDAINGKEITEKHCIVPISLVQRDTTRK